MQIQVKEYEFEIGEPYAEGQTLGAAEAAHLNKLRGENIRGSMGPKVNAALRAAQGPLLSNEVLAELQREAERIDQAHVLQMPLLRAKTGTIASTARAIAEARADSAALAAGRLLEGEDRETAIAAMLGLEDIWEEARQRLRLTASAASAALESLL